MKSIASHYCNQDPGTRPDRPHHWSGFYDAAIWYSVCNGCKAHHHQVKLQLAAAEKKALLAKKKKTAKKSSKKLKAKAV